MRINLHIERLVLDELSIDRAQGRRVQKAIERELTTRLTHCELHDALRNGANMHRIQTSDIQLANEIDAAGLGKQIAGAVLRGIAK